MPHLNHTSQNIGLNSADELANGTGFSPAGEVMQVNSHTTDTGIQKHAGVRFEGVALPDNAIILLALLDITISINDSTFRADVHLDQDWATGASYDVNDYDSSGADSNADVTSRAKSTSWGLLTGTVAKLDHLTFDFTSQLQDIVDGVDRTWTSNDGDFGILLFGDTVADESSEMFTTSAGGEANRPQLRVDYNLPTTASHVKAYDGAAWQTNPIYRYTGSAWEGAVLKRFNGTTWDLMS